MAKEWVLDTETKGTGAQMVPLEKVLREPASTAGVLIQKEPRERPPTEPEPRRPREFKVVDAMTQQVLADGADARETMAVLEGVRSVVDVSIYARSPKAPEWRTLSIGERKVLWEAARSAPAPDS